MPLALDICSGLGGWAIGLESAGWTVIRVDIEDMFLALGEPKPAECLLMLQDMRTVTGVQMKDVRLIVGSSPCPDFSYRAMPWTRARALTGPFLGIKLFHEQFRIQREICEAAGVYVPAVFENVRGAERWIGKARWHAGSMAFWGDVPACMPKHKHIKVKSFRFDGSGRSFQSSAVAEHTGRSPAPGSGARFTSIERAERANGKPSSLAWGNESRWFNDGPRSPDSISSSSSSSSSPARKKASALIAKIPLPIASHIGRVFMDAHLTGRRVDLVPIQQELW